MSWCGRMRCSARESAFSGRYAVTARVSFSWTSSASGSLRELVRIDQTTRQLVVGVGRQPVTLEEDRLVVERVGVAFHQPADLGARRLRARHRVRARETRHVLPEAVSRDEPMEVVRLEVEAREIVPAAHVFSRRGHAGHLSEHLQQTVIVEVQEALVVLVELALHGSVEELHVRVRKRRERQRRDDGSPRGLLRANLAGAPDGSGGRRRHRCLKERSPVDSCHGRLLFAGADAAQRGASSALLTAFDRVCTIDGGALSTPETAIVVEPSGSDGEARGSRSLSVSSWRAASDPRQTPVLAIRRTRSRRLCGRATTTRPSS